MNRQMPDDVYATEARGWEIPPEGVHQAVCCDVVDLGDIATDWGLQHKVKLVFQLECQNGERKEDGKRFEVWRRFSLKLGPRTHLQPFLESWRGKQLSPEEAKNFKMSTLVDANAQVQIMHEEKNGNTYANIVAILPWNPKNGQKIVPENYERWIPETPTITTPTPAERAGNRAFHAPVASNRPQQKPVAKQAVQEDDPDIPF